MAIVVTPSVCIAEFTGSPAKVLDGKLVVMTANLLRAAAQLICSQKILYFR